MHILVATDGAPHSDTALQLGGYLAESIGASVTLLTVIKNEAERVQAEAILSRAETFLPAGIELQQKIRAGQSSEEIVQEVRESEQDLLILGERTHHGLAQRIPRSTVNHVLQQMPCPVLIARGPFRPPKRILVCESGRDPSLTHRLVAQLQDFIANAESLTVLHVMSQIAAGPGVDGWELRADAEELMEDHAPEGGLLEDDLKRLEGLPVQLEAKVRHGLVVKEILKEVRNGDYDLAVIGAHQGKRWERFLLDDLAQEIIEHTDRPVLVV